MKKKGNKKMPRLRGEVIDNPIASNVGAASRNTVIKDRATTLHRKP